LEMKHKDVLDRLSKGEYNDELTSVLETVAKEVAQRHK